MAAFTTEELDKMEQGVFTTEELDRMEEPASVNMLAQQKAEREATIALGAAPKEPSAVTSQMADPADVGPVTPTPPIQWSLADIGRIPGRVGGTLKMGGLQVGESMARAVQHGAEFVAKEVFPDLKDKDIRSFFEASATYPVGAAKHEKFLSDVARIPDMLADVAQAKREKILTGRSRFTFRESPILYATELVEQNLPTTAVALGVGILAGAPAGLAVMGVSEFGSAAEQQAGTGASIEKQTMIGILSAAAEIGGEMLVFPKILKGVEGGGFTVRAIMDIMAENAGQETVTGFAQGFLQTFGIETSKGIGIKEAVEKALMAGLAAMPENAWVGGLSAGVTTTSITAAGKAIDTIKHIAAVKETIEKPDADAIATVDAQIENIQKDETIPEEQKKAIIGILGNIVTDWETKIISKIPGEITDLESLEKWGNAVAKDLGVDKILEELAKKHGIQPNIVWQVTDKAVARCRAWAEGPEIGGTRERFGIKIWDFERAVRLYPADIKNSVIHELAHFAQKPRIDRGRIIRRAIHHPEFKSWLAAKIAEQLPKKRIAVPRKETGPQEIELTPQGEIAPAAGKAITELKYDDTLISKRGKEFWTVVSVNQENQTAIISREQASDTPSNTRKISLKTLSRFYTIQDKIVVPPAPAAPAAEKVEPRPSEPTKKKPSGKKLKREAHKIQKQYKISDEDFYALEEETTGKRSMKDMTVGEMASFVKALREMYGPITGLSEDDLERPIFFKGKWIPAEQVFGPVVSLVDGLPNVGKIPAHVVPGGIGAAPKKLVSGIWRVFMGLYRARPSRLFNILGGFKNTILTDIGHDLIEDGAERKSNHQMSFYTDGVWKFFAEKGFDSKALAGISRTQWRGPMPYKVMQELLGKGMKRTDIKFGKTTYSITRSSLCHHYLQVRQPDGMAHAVKDGLIFAEVHTGPLTEAEVTTQIINQAKSDPFCVAAAEWIDTVAPYYWRDPTNNISVLLIGKKIATKKNWYTLNVEETPRYSKLGFKLKVEKKVVNLLENPSYFRERKGPTGALQDGDFFETIEAIEEAISDYVAYAPSVRLVLTLLGHKGLVRTWRQKGYGDFHKALNEIVPNEMGSPGPRSPIELAVAALTRGGARGLFHWNLKTAGIQISSMLLLRKHFDAEYVRAGTIGAATHKMEKEFFPVNPWAWCRYFMDRGPRMIGGIAEHGGLTLQMQGKYAANQMGGWLLKNADLEPFHVAFWAAIAEYDDYVAGKIRPDSRAETYWAGKPIVEKNSPQWETLIRERFTVGRRGQQSYDKFDRSVNTSNKSVWNKLAFLFQSFHEGAWNMMQMSWDEWIHNPKTWASTAKAGLDIGTVWASYVTEQILRDSIIMVTGFTMAAIRRRKRKEPLHWYEWILRPFISILDAIPMIGSAANMYTRNFVRILAKEKPIYGGRVGEPLPLKLVNDAFEGADGIGRGVAYYLTGETKKGNKATISGIKKLFESIALTQGMPTYEIRRILNATEGKTKTEPPTIKGGGAYKPPVIKRNK